MIIHNWILSLLWNFQLEFPSKPRGKLQKEDDEKYLKSVKEQKNGKNEKPGKGTVAPGDGVKITDNGLYEMLQEYMIENETLRSVVLLKSI